MPKLALETTALACTATSTTALGGREPCHRPMRPQPGPKSCARPGRPPKRLAGDEAPRGSAQDLVEARHAVERDDAFAPCLHTMLSHLLASATPRAKAAAGLLHSSSALRGLHASSGAKSTANLMSCCRFNTSERSARLTLERARLRIESRGLRLSARPANLSLGHFVLDQTCDTRS